MKRGTEAGERPPLRHRLEVVHRFRGFNLHSAQELAAAVCRLEHEVRVPRQGPDGDGHRLQVAGIAPNLELSLVFRVEQADDPIVLKLLADGSHENRAQLVLQDVCKTG